MLRTNLSSRPFYRERLVSLALMAAAIGLVTLSVFNFSRVTTLSAERAEHDRNIALNRDEAARVRADIQAAVAGVDMNQLQQLVAGTAEANTLITERTFSWSQFFDIVEKAMPYEVRLVGVAHRVEDGERVLVLNVVAQEDEQLNEFVRGMLETGAFFDVLPVEKARNEDGTVSAIVETYYLPPAAAGNASPGTGVSR
jgi:hypothetical protein